MQLICGKTYLVSLHTNRWTTARFHLTFCGGACVDAEGHWVGGGVWAHRHTPSRHGNDAVRIDRPHIACIWETEQKDWNS